MTTVSKMIDIIIAAAVADLMPDGIPVRSPSVIRRVIERTAQQSYEVGRGAAVGELLTPPQVAAMLGIDRTRVLRLAKSRHVGWQVGRDWLFRPEDVEAMRARRTGRSRQSE